MHYIAIADTDIGIAKKTNQDSILIEQAKYDDGEILMAVICDGMGGLAKGELASATVIRAFSKWFNEELPVELEQLDMSIIGAKWNWLLKELNMKILNYGTKNNTSLGTTFTGVLFVNNKFVVAHVGDTRLYKIDSNINQLTEDQTFVAREIKLRRMTPEQAKFDKRRNMLLQCIGASKKVEPTIFTGEASKGVYMLCSDGFRHEITEQEIYSTLKPSNMVNKDEMHAGVRYLIEQVKDRQERDNISVVLIKVE